MTIHEFGKENDKIMVLLHPAVVMWDFFEYVIPALEKKYHLIIPAIPGYDPNVKNDFTSVEEIAVELEIWLKVNGISHVDCIYGCSMGGAFITKLLSNGLFQIRYQLQNKLYCPIIYPSVLY